MKTETFELVGIAFDISYYDDQINEVAYKGQHLIGNFSYQKHQPHNPTGEYHIHLYQNNKQILSINKSGTAHDGYHGNTNSH